MTSDLAPPGREGRTQKPARGPDASERVLVSTVNVPAADRTVKRLRDGLR